MIQQHHAQSAAAAAMAAAAAAAAAAQGTAPGAHPVFDLAKFWQEQLHVAESFESDFKNHPLPLARIKKVMKTDQDVKVRDNRYLGYVVILRCKYWYLIDDQC